MPNALFYSISEEKRKRFIAAAYHQLTTKNYVDVTISSIAKEAGISRGTVYNYFDSVGAILEYIIAEIQDDRQEYLFRFFVDSDYNIFRTFHKVFEFEYQRFIDTGRYSIIRNYFSYLTVENKSFQDSAMQQIIGPLIERSGRPIYDPDVYHVTPQQFFQSVEMILTLVIKLIDRAQQQDLPKDELFAQISYVMTVFERGMKHFDQ